MLYSKRHSTPWSGPVAGFGFPTVLLALVICGLLPAKGATKTPAEVRKSIAPFVRSLPTNAQEKAMEKPALAKLGRTLFYDRRLSAKGDRSCNDCHDLANYGSNGALLNELRKEKKLRRDAPSVYNTAHLKLFYWNGSKTDLKAQTTSALLGSREMGFSRRNDVVARLQAIKGYSNLFREAWPESDNPITFDNVIKALNQFELGLVTPGPFDRFLRGDDTALNEDQLKGALLFQKHDCGACHTGNTFGGQMIQKLGALKPWPNRTDPGYYEVTRQPAHRMFFRVQGLRNVEKTTPYFHDNSTSSLKLAIQRMAIHERGRRLASHEIELIAEFLKSLTGTIPTNYIQKPDLPE